jgi:hypothetical protein
MDTHTLAVGEARLVSSSKSSYWSCCNIQKVLTADPCYRTCRAANLHTTRHLLQLCWDRINNVKAAVMPKHIDHGCMHANTWLKPETPISDKLCQGKCTVPTQLTLLPCGSHPFG